MKALIIDDEPLARSIVREYLRQFPEIHIIGECGDGFEGLKSIQEQQPDLIFLDIQMPKINGFEMLELVSPMPLVIFTTAFDEYAIKAFEAHAVDYLLKPFSIERFQKAVQKLVSTSVPGAEKNSGLLTHAALNPLQRQRIVVKNGSRIKIIPVSEIFYLEAADDYVKIHTSEGIFLKNKTMAYFEELLEETQFLRSHRSYILNIPQVIRIEPYEKDGHLAVLKCGEKIPVSRPGFLKLKRLLDI